MTKRDGGPAYPRAPYVIEPLSGGYQEYFGNPGMTLRDWFAGQALIGLLASGPHDCTPKEIAHDCAQYADAMIGERDKEQTP